MIIGVPSFAAATAFGPLETIMALTGLPSVSAMSSMLTPWLARLTITLTTSPRPTSRATSRNWAALRSGPTSGVTTRKISPEMASIAMVRSS